MRAGSTKARAVLGLVVVAALVLAGGLTFLAVHSSSDGAPAVTGAAPSTATDTGSAPGDAPVTSVPQGPPLYVAPQAAGSGDGSSWADAGELADLPDLVSQRPGGGEIWLRADTGPYQVEDSLRISAGGADGSPVVVRGVDVDGRPSPAVLQGTRTSPYDPDGESGGDVFSLRGGASHLVFRDLAFENVDNAFLAAGDATDLVIADTSATNVRRFFENAKSDQEPSADVSGLVIRDVTVTGFSKRVVRLRYGSNDVLLEDVIGDSQQQDGDDFAIGVHLQDDVHNVMLRRVTMSNTRDSLHDYWNGDGFATERDVHDITFEDTTASGNTDAGYDLKSTQTTLVDATSRDNKRNFRFWADDLTARGCQGLDPHKRGGSSSQAQVWLGKGARVQLDGCTFRDTDPETVVFVLEPDARLSVTGGAIEHAGDLKALQQGATVDLQDVTR
ncbi:hypothetical protein SAMN05661080_04222 [Modestobacter sp. DSM 44400]|uniref:hypothetical protein n=1 Tax=Modestobacter sp. DSM 44400 TaxID=1550230 RepID=UPI0008956C08|nr:hypothetical protein [Modestobacter sp. DSM 44400]SDY66807.1 hypothetical protein SAMN05661080_04222 [Modestobacter sp. DSM 44400]